MLIDVLNAFFASFLAGVQNPLIFLNFNVYFQSQVHMKSTLSVRMSDILTIPHAMRKRQKDKIRQE